MKDTVTEAMVDAALDAFAAVVDKSSAGFMAIEGDQITIDISPANEADVRLAFREAILAAMEVRATRSE